MLVSTVVWQPRLSSLVAFGYLTSVAICSYVITGDTYWSGRTQPIGIDFASDRAFAVYADSPNNFTILGAVCPGEDNPYTEYMYSLYLHRGDPGPSVIIDDGDCPVSQGWFQKPAHWISSRYQYLLRAILCSEYHPFVKSQWHYDLCKHVPRKPRSTSNHRKLLSKWRMRRLQALMPNWIRAPDDQMLLTRSNFVLSILDLLEELKKSALRDHNIRITSAIISRPTWVYSDTDFIFEEACFLAGIERLEPSHDRAEIVTKTALPGSSVLVLDHGQCHLDFRHAVWDELNKKHVIQGSMGIADSGSLLIMEQLVKYITGNYIVNATQEEAYPFTIVDIQHGVQQVATAIHDLRYGREWQTEQELENRSIGVTFRQYKSNWTTMINITSQDVVEVENWYISEISKAVQVFLARSSVNDYRQSQGYFDLYRTPKEDQADILNVVANVTPPVEIGSWFKYVDHLIILDTTMNTELLRTAVEKTLGWNNTGVGEMCIPTATFAARGAALRARQWGDRYDKGARPRRWDEDERDWVPLEEWIEL